MSKVNQDNSNKSGNSIKKVQSEMLVSNIDHLPGQVGSPKVQVELASYYQSRKGHIGTLPNILVDYQ